MDTKGINNKESANNVPDRLPSGSGREPVGDVVGPLERGPEGDDVVQPSSSCLVVESYVKVQEQSCDNNGKKFFGFPVRCCHRTRMTATTSSTPYGTTSPSRTRQMNPLSLPPYNPSPNIYIKTFPRRRIFQTNSCCSEERSAREELWSRGVGPAGRGGGSAEDRAAAPTPLWMGPPRPPPALDFFVLAGGIFFRVGKGEFNLVVRRTRTICSASAV